MQFLNCASNSELNQSFDSFYKCCMKAPNENWIQKVANSNWLNHVQHVLKSANMISGAMLHRNKHCVLHDDTGFDMSLVLR